MFPLFDLNPLEWFKNTLFGGVITDINLILLGFKLVILLFIVSFVRARFGGGPVVTILVFLLGYIMLFTDYFAIFGPAMFIYLFVIFGFTSIVFDLAIAKPWKKMPKMEGGEPDTTYKEARERQEAMRKMRGRF